MAVSKPASPINTILPGEILFRPTVVIPTFEIADL
jgi:hypothetical protein